MSQMTSLETLRGSATKERLVNYSEQKPVLFDLNKSSERTAVLTTIFGVIFPQYIIETASEKATDTTVENLTVLTEEQLESAYEIALAKNIVTDEYREQLIELFRLKPEGRSKTPVEIEQMVERSGRDSLTDGVIVYYPDTNTFNHILSEEEFWQLFTIRNYPVLNAETQQKLRNLHVGIAGSSVGGRVALALARMGVGEITLADAGTVSLEKVAMGSYQIDNLGKYKALSIALMLYHINPYMKIKAVPELVTEGNITELFSTADAVVESVDSLAAKQMIQQFGIDTQKIVLAPTDLGLGAVVESITNTAFNDKLNAEDLALLEKAKTAPDSEKFQILSALAPKIVGLVNIPSYMFAALGQLKNEGLSYLPQPAIAPQIMSALVVGMIIEWLETGAMPAKKNYDLRS